MGTVKVVVDVGQLAVSLNTHLKGLVLNRDSSVLLSNLQVSLLTWSWTACPPVHSGCLSTPVAGRSNILVVCVPQCQPARGK